MNNNKNYYFYVIIFFCTLCIHHGDITYVVAFHYGGMYQHRFNIHHIVSSDKNDILLLQLNAGSNNNNYNMMTRENISLGVHNVLKLFSEWYSNTVDKNVIHRGTNSLLSILHENVVWDDCHYMYQPLHGIRKVERHLQFQRISFLGRTPSSLVIDQIVEMNDISEYNSTTAVTVGFTYYMCERTNGIAEGMALPNRRGIVLLDLELVQNTLYIVSVNIIREKILKQGEVSLRILAIASNFLRRPVMPSSSTVVRNDERALTLPEQYFYAWNKRDMDAAVSVFTDNVSYDDTAFPQPFVGKESLRDHLTKCASCFPESFLFEVYRVIQQPNENKIIVSWHVKNGSDRLPFTNGASYYEINSLQQKISKGIDFVDSKSLKTASFVDPIISLFRTEPIRWIPSITWLAYLYVVFISDGILPGANALQLELRTWEEVRDLSLNFFLVAPTLNLPFSPVVHPMLEGVFNVLLSWAAMFAGFLSDDRRNKPNIFPMLPMVVGMQFLTSAFLLPYLAVRTPEYDETETYFTDLDFVSQAVESRIWALCLSIVGSYSIFWANFGRITEFGSISERWATFLDLLSIDRVGSSFIVDLFIFALFQGWLIDDDLKRRGVNSTDMTMLRFVAKLVPFFGMAAYLALRPPLPRKPNSTLIEF